MIPLALLALAAYLLYIGIRDNSLVDLALGLLGLLSAGGMFYAAITGHSLFERIEQLFAKYKSGA
ncbi:hypothetical protein IC617_03610 [Neiella sp. HB171785]|uniref:Uncharacterized protein n=1 Tax=Neiella litorisoli TaxID=2771431 RepID=A0A8J6QPB0_9GAMM|nr:hypothetical protein [Neiella litorisoli]MBD1388506.1 hypothetical protein [Neiella litorisoli]